MKKLLTIMVLALALCLVCSAALAAVEKYPGAQPAVGNKINDEAGIEREIWKVEQLDSESKDLEYNTFRCFMKNETGTDNTNEYKDYLVNLHIGHLATSTITAATPATCWTAGKYTVKCNVCGYTYDRTIPAGKKINPTTNEATVDLGHEAAGKWEDRVRVTATCTTEGVNGTYCTVCKVWKPDGDTKTGLYDVHIYTKKVEIAPFTCQGNGSYYMACVNCGKREPNKPAITVDNITDYQTLLNDSTYFPLKAMPADYDGHDYTAWGKETEPTCAKAATYVRWCKNGCGATQSKEGTAAADKKLEALWIIDPNQALNCQKTTGIKVICSRCNGSVHNDTVNATTDGEVYAPNSGVNKGAFLMTLPHVYKIEETYKGTKVAATCTKGAYIPYRCIYDNTHAEYQLPVTSEPALGHNWDAWHISTAVDENGNHYYWRRCKRCGETQREFKVPTELCDVHDFKVTTEPTCTEAGVKTCSKCGTTEEVAALGHDWDETVKKAATCKEEGLKNRVCKRCGIGETDIKVEKLAHTWDEGKITKEATKEAKGEKTFTCTVCGETKTEEVEYVITAAPKYTMTGVQYNGTAVTGKLVHDEDTLEAPAKYVRVTFYIEGNYYMAANAEVDADGSFSVEGVGPIVYITVVANRSSSVNPDDVKPIAPAEEIYVK